MVTATNRYVMSDKMQMGKDNIAKLQRYGRWVNTRRMGDMVTA